HRGMVLVVDAKARSFQPAGQSDLRRADCRPRRRPSTDRQAASQCSARGVRSGGVVIFVSRRHLVAVAAADDDRTAARTSYSGRRQQALVALDPSPRRSGKQFLIRLSRSWAGCSKSPWRLTSWCIWSFSLWSWIYILNAA